jgi:transcriptional regulator with XRE-family HTH domain
MREGPRRLHPVEALLAARGSSKRWLAKKLHDMDESTLNRYLSGERTPPSDLYERIADVLQVPLWVVTPKPREEPTTAA